MLFHIWSNREKAWWKPGGQGYTKKKVEAGTFTVEQAGACNLDSCSGNTPAGADVLVPTKSWHER